MNNNIYKTFKYSARVAEEFYYENVKAEDCLNCFWNTLDDFCKEHQVSYTKELSENGITKSYRVELKPGLCAFTIPLNEYGEPSGVSVRCLAFEHMNEIRDLIWETKTFFGLPVFAVMAMDDDFANYPRNFVITVTPRSQVEKLIESENAYSRFEEDANSRLSQYGLSLDYLDFLINKYGR